MTKHREIAIDIVSLFDELLERHNIYIPDDYREGNEDEACLYGNTYYELEDAVAKIIEDSCEVKR